MQTIPELPRCWTAIAERPRLVGEPLDWIELPSRLLGVIEARGLAEKGLILMANRHTDARVALVIRPATT